MVLLQVQDKVSYNSCLLPSKGEILLYIHLSVSIKYAPNAYRWKIEMHGVGWGIRMPCTEPFPRRAHVSPEWGDNLPELTQQVNHRAENRVQLSCPEREPGRLPRGSRSRRLPLYKQEGQTHTLTSGLRSNPVPIPCPYFSWPL